MSKFNGDLSPKQLLFYLVLILLCLLFGTKTKAQNSLYVGIKCPKCDYEAAKIESTTKIWQHARRGNGRFESIENDTIVIEIDWEFERIEVGSKEYAIEYHHYFSPINHAKIWFNNQTLILYYDNKGNYTHHKFF